MRSHHATYTGCLWEWGEDAPPFPSFPALFRDTVARVYTRFTGKRAVPVPSVWKMGLLLNEGYETQTGMHFACCRFSLMDFLPLPPRTSSSPNHARREVSRPLHFRHLWRGCPSLKAGSCCRSNKYCLTCMPLVCFIRPNPPLLQFICTVCWGCLT